MKNISKELVLAVGVGAIVGSVATVVGKKVKQKVTAVSCKDELDEEFEDELDDDFPEEDLDEEDVTVPAEEPLNEDEATTPVSEESDGKKGSENGSN